MINTIMKMDILNTNDSGIYAIVNTLNQKMYIGSTICFRERYNEHKRFLRKNKHHSARLQHSWNKHGEEHFIFRDLAIVNDPSVDLLKLEKHFIIEKNTVDDRFGYNITSETDKYKRLPDIMRKKAGKYFLVSPSGDEFTTSSLANFCREREIDLNTLYKVAKGKYAHHKYWRCWLLEERPTKIANQFDFKEYVDEQNRVKWKAVSDKHNASQQYFSYTVVSPVGEIFYPKSLKSFCKDYGLEESCMYDLANGIRNFPHRGGWTVTKKPL